MPPPKTSTTRLPRDLLEQLNIDPRRSNGRPRNSSRKVPGRKERRRNEKLEKKNFKRNSTSSRNRHSDRHEEDDDDEPSDIENLSSEEYNSPEPKAVQKVEVKPKTAPKPEKASKPSAKGPVKSILKKPAREVVEEDERYIRKAVKDKLAEDDAEIAALEKKLKIKGKKIPKSFQEDGLDFLLEGLDDLEELERPRGVKRKRTKEPEPDPESSSDQEFADDDDVGDITDESDGGSEEFEQDSEDEDAERSDAEDAINEDHNVKKAAPETDIYGNRKKTTTDATAAGKYIPPSLRKPSIGDTEELARLRRRVQGPLNRLSEANLLGIAGEIEQIFCENPRHHVTSTLIDLILASVCDRTTHLDTFMILHAGFIAALYKVIGTDFGAHVTQRLVEEFDKFYGRNSMDGSDAGGKETTNIISLLSEMYNFQVISSNLMFDIVRIFLKDINELNTELLLKVVRNSGPQLRADDPTALKDLVLMMQPSISKIGEENLSVRTKFMIETITNLKNNRLKNAAANSVILLEATQRMKKILGSLNTRQLRATEPLRASLEDIRNVETKGKWWLVGASWRDNLYTQDHDKSEDTPSAADLKKGDRKAKKVTDTDTLDGGLDMLQLAREQRMNTDIRRAIFVTIMSSEDYVDACEKLLKLRLKKTQEREIPRVLVHCCGSEQMYNPYYALIARRLCAQHSLKMALQFCLWDLFRRMGENDGAYEGDDEDEDDGELSMRKIVNLGKLFGTLVAETALPLSILKVLNLTYLQSRTKTFLEVFFIALILRTQPNYKSGEHSEKALMAIILQVSDNADLQRGILYFLKKHLRNTDIAGGDVETEVVKWGVRVAGDALKAAVTQDVAR